MVQGFLTIATGDLKYYKLARTLLRSYRQTCSSPMRFAILADRQNEYTSEFDDVVILDTPYRSWMDKMQLLKYCPYDENIFIDADCIIYHDINYLWNLFKNADDFSCFGKAMPLDSQEGWFTSEAKEIYPIHFITHLHGIMYFIRKGEMIDRMDQLCQEIIANYNTISYKAFNEIIADEPIYALAMAVLNLKPIERKPEYYCFVPYATMIKTDYYNKKVTYCNPTDGRVEKCDIVHWGNINITKHKYMFDAHIINYFAENHDGGESLHNLLLYKLKMLNSYYCLQDYWRFSNEKISWFFERVSVKLTGKERR